jgi:hypothetical protein
MLHAVQHDKIIFLVAPLSGKAEERGDERSDVGVSRPPRKSKIS